MVLLHEARTIDVVQQLDVEVDAGQHVVVACVILQRRRSSRELLGEVVVRVPDDGRRHRQAGVGRHIGLFVTHTHGHAGRATANFAVPRVFGVDRRDVFVDDVVVVVPRLDVVTAEPQVIGRNSVVQLLSVATECHLAVSGREVVVQAAQAIRFESTGRLRFRSPGFTTPQSPRICAVTRRRCCMLDVR